jgi:hypothetical protein
VTLWYTSLALRLGPQRGQSCPALWFWFRGAMLSVVLLCVAGFGGAHGYPDCPHYVQFKGQ